jgi:hypothetical protein
MLLEAGAVSVLLAGEIPGQAVIPNANLSFDGPIGIDEMNVGLCEGGLKAVGVNELAIGLIGKVCSGQGYRCKDEGKALDYFS